MWECNSMYYTKNYNNLKEWLQLVKDDKEVYPFCKIPYYNWFDEYIKNIREESVDSVKDMLRVLLCPINRRLDEDNYKAYLNYLNSDIEAFKEIAEKMKHNEMYNRIAKGQNAWDGITWVLELLPNSPYKAIRALENYLLAQHSLPDDRITGIEQSAEIISARFIYYEQSIEKLLKLKPIEFEWLIEELYKAMGYKTKWTQATRDGGKDIIANINRIDGLEKVYIECKLYSTTELKRESVGYLIYNVLNDSVNRGVIFCTGYVSKNLKNMDTRIQIWTYEDMNILFNSFLGINWADNLEKIIERKRLQYNDKEYIR